jgi:predicted transcriptional regulator
MAAQTSDGPAAPAHEPSPQEGTTTSAPEYATRDMLRAMAHPLRLQLMERIGRRGTARAADLAEDLGVPANSISYHLRTLLSWTVLVGH